MECKFRRTGQPMGMKTWSVLMRCDASRVGEQDRQRPSDFAFLHSRCEPATSNSTYDHLSTLMHEAHLRRINAPLEGHALRIAIVRNQVTEMRELLPR